MQDVRGRAAVFCDRGFRYFCACVGMLVQAVKEDKYWGKSLKFTLSASGWCFTIYRASPPLSHSDGSDWYRKCCFPSRHAVFPLHHPLHPLRPLSCCDRARAPVSRPKKSNRTQQGDILRSAVLHQVISCKQLRAACPTTALRAVTTAASNTVT